MGYRQFSSGFQALSSIYACVQARTNWTIECTQLTRTHCWTKMTDLQCRTGIPKAGEEKDNGLSSNMVLKSSALKKNSLFQ